MSTLSNLRTLRRLGCSILQQPDPRRNFCIDELDLSVAHFKGLSLHVVSMLIPMLHDFKRESHGEILRELAGSSMLTD